MSELQNLIETTSDINEHLSVMNKYAKECTHITEFGVRNIVSTWAWLEAYPKTVICYDIVEPDSARLDQVIEFVNKNNIEFDLKLQDVLKVVIEPTELLFIDTLHYYDQLIQELTLHSDKVYKYIILHDTEGFGEVGYDGNNNVKKGLRYALDEFLDTNKNWAIHEQFKNNYGLTILKRI